ncbi:MAG: helix-turn-helix transcriptional regulator [Clostridia bacterium]|nr:helix-turn-helix transcriptional regulator [Clostridia bacterium]
MNVEILNCLASAHTFEIEGQSDQKTVPFITVVSCLEGSYELLIDGKPYTIHAGECFYTPEYAEQKIIHHVCPDGTPMRAQWVYITVLINQKHNLKRYYDIPCKLPPEASRKIHAYISEFRANQARQDLTGQITRQYLQYGILYELIGCGKAVECKDSIKLETVLQLIDTQLCATMSAGEIARTVNYSESYLYRLFKDELGMSPKQYIIKRCLQKSLDMLTKTDMSIKDISACLGFCDQFHFSKKFLQEFRCTPSEYRKDYAYFK